MGKILRSIGIFALCVVCACVLIYTIGMIVDLASSPALKKEGELALEELQGLQKKVENNAWDYYTLIIQEMKARGQSDNVSRYFNQEIELTRDIRKELDSYTAIVELIRQANAMPSCWIPVNYEEGIFAQLPEYQYLVHAAKILGAQTLAALESGDTKIALDKTTLGFGYTKQIMHGSPILMNYMISDVMLGINLHVLEVALSSGVYDETQLTQLQHTLTSYEYDMPSLITAFELENAGMKISMMQIPINTPLFEPVEVIQGNVFGKFVERLAFWRYFFSPHQAMLKAIRKTDDILLTAKQKTQNLQGVEKELAILRSLKESDFEGYGKQNIVFALYRPPFKRAIAQKVRNQARVRLMLCAIDLRIHQHKYGNWPQKIDAFDQYIITDPFTEASWDYQHVQEKVELKSPGFDKEFGTGDDISICLE
jgi:hypothetical protein